MSRLHRRLGHQARAGLAALLAVGARWPGGGADPWLLWPRPQPDDPRGPLALALLRALHVEAGERRLPVQGADAELSWGRAADGRRTIEARVHIACAVPTPHVDALCGAASRHRRVQELLSDDLALRCVARHVDHVDPRLLPIVW